MNETDGEKEMDIRLRNKRRWFSTVLCAALLAGLFTGCAQKNFIPDVSETEEIVIPMILTVDSTTGIKNEQKVVESFNAAYTGTYRVDVDWIMETEEEYRQNLKRLNVTDELPAVITDLRMLPSFYQRMIKEGRIEDLSEAINGDEEWKSMIEPVVLEGCSEADGKIYLGPISTAVFSCSGVFWNQELFARAGIEKFPETWEEFWECCETLQANGITPLALHTEGTAWAAMLLATAELADSESGAAFMKELYPDSYQNENGLRLAATLKRLLSYTTEDAFHSDFDVAYTHFVNGEAAMVPNGYWMIDQIPANMVEKVHFAPFPGNKLISSPETFGWAIVSSYSDEVKEGAMKFLKYRTKLNQEEKEKLLAGELPGMNQLTEDYIQAFQNNPQFVPNYQVKWNSVLQEKTLGEALPELASGKISIEQFTQMADESIEEFEREQ